MRRILPVLLLSIAAPAFAQPPSKAEAVAVDASPTTAVASSRTRPTSRFGLAMAELTRVARERAAATDSTHAASTPAAGNGDAHPAPPASASPQIADSNGR